MAAAPRCARQRWNSVCRGGSPWYGATVFRSEDDGATWAQSSAGLTYGEDAEKVTHIWHLAPSSDGKTIYAGVEPAGLFRSDDRGENWAHVSGLREHPSQPEWQPGNGGLILHSIAPRSDQSRSSVGRHLLSWGVRDAGRREDVGNAEQGRARRLLPGDPPEFGQCVHKMLIDPVDPERLIQQNHCGVYRTDDGGSTWTEITNNLPTDFGFPMGVHPRETDTLWVIPLTTPENGRHMIEGHAAVWRSRTAATPGSRWTTACLPKTRT